MRLSLNIKPRMQSRLTPPTPALDPLSGQVFSLDTLAVNQSACMAGCSLPLKHRARLLEMGFTPGIKLKVIRFAPLGDPMEVEVRGYRLLLRRSEASHIQVTQEAL